MMISPFDICSDFFRSPLDLYHCLVRKYSEKLKRTPSQHIVYEVNAGETLQEIASRHNTTVDILAEVNGITTGRSVGPRQMRILLILQY